MTSQTGQQIITIHILPNISRSTDNQTMKFGHLKQNKMGNAVEKLVPEHFIKKSKLRISLDQQPEKL